MPVTPSHERGPQRAEQEAEPDELGIALRRRLRRLQLRRVQPAVLPWVIVCWVLTAAALVVLFWPGALAMVTAAPQPDGLVGLATPGWYRLFITLAGAVVAGGVVVAHGTPRTDGEHPRLRSGIEEALIAVALLTPVLVLLADRAWLLAVVALAAGIAAELLIHRTAQRVLPGILTAVAWLVLAAHSLTPTGMDAASWTWIVLPGLGAAVAAFGAYYGVARAAEARTRTIRVLFRERWSPVWVAVAVALAVLVTVLRLTVARELFPVPDPELWSPWTRHWSSWLLAAVVVAALVVVAIRSTRRPLRRVGQRRVTLGLALLGNLHLIAAGFVIVVALVAAVFGVVAVPAEVEAAVPWLKVLGVVALGSLMLLPSLAGTAARWLGIVAALFLIPNTLIAALRTSGLEAPSFAPSPVQVTLLLVGVAAVCAVLNLTRPASRPAVRPSLVVRLAVVPLIAVHAGWLLPAIWSEFGLILAAVLLVIGVLLLQPPPARDNATHSARTLVAATSQLFGFGIALLAAPSLLDDPSLIVLGLVWLSVVVVAALCFETVAREDEETRLEPARVET